MLPGAIQGGGSPRGAGCFPATSATSWVCYSTHSNPLLLGALRGAAPPFLTSAVGVEAGGRVGINKEGLSGQHEWQWVCLVCRSRGEREGVGGLVMVPGERSDLCSFLDGEAGSTSDLPLQAELPWKRDTHHTWT